jgi:hypothetical protein
MKHTTPCTSCGTPVPAVRPHPWRTPHPHDGLCEGCWVEAVWGNEGGFDPYEWTNGYDPRDPAPEHPEDWPS